MPSPDSYEIEMGDPLVRLIVRRRDDSSLDLRLARCSPNASPADPARWRLTQAGFRLSRAAAVELRAVLREVAGV